MPRHLPRSLFVPLILIAATAPAPAQVTGPPMGGPSGRFLAPPASTVGSFLGVWDLSWEGPVDFGCPCRGTLTITTNDKGELEGVWKMKGAPATLRGSVGYDQNVWIGKFEQSDEVDFPLTGHFRLESRGESLLTGSYQPDGTAIPFSWTGRR